MTESHWEVLILSGQSSARTSSSNISAAVPGNVPNPLYLPSGCRFHPRCDFSKNTCKSEMPNLENISNEHYVRCSLWKNINLQINHA